MGKVCSKIDLYEMQIVAFQDSISSRWEPMADDLNLGTCEVTDDGCFGQYWAERGWWRNLRVCALALCEGHTRVLGRLPSARPGTRALLRACLASPLHIFWAAWQRQQRAPV